MKKRRIYYRRKGKGTYIIQGVRVKTPVYIWTLPKDPIQLLETLQKSSYFTKEKWEKIKTLIVSLNKINNKGENKV